MLNSRWFGYKLCEKKKNNFNPFFVEEKSGKFFQWQILINLSQKVLVKIHIFILIIYIFFSMQRFFRLFNKLFKKICGNKLHYFKFRFITPSLFCLYFYKI